MAWGRKGAYHGAFKDRILSGTGWLYIYTPNMVTSNLVPRQRPRSGACPAALDNRSGAAEFFDRALTTSGTGMSFWKPFGRIGL